MANIQINSPSKTSLVKKQSSSHEDKKIISFSDFETGYNFNKLARRRKGQENQPFSDGKKDKKKLLTEKGYFDSKQRAKAISFSVASKLVLLGSPLSNSYRNSLYCNSEIEKTGNKVTSKYCKNRFCSICNRIRTAKLIHSYLPVFKTWEELSFVTLTIRNVSGEELRDAILRMEREFKKIVDVLRKRGAKLKAIKKLEITYNPDRDDFHPHYHIITEYLRGDLIALWKDHFPEIDYRAQDIAPARVGSEKELFKYFSKVIFKGQFFPVQLDIIFQSVYKKQVFQTYGFKLTEEQKKAEEIEKLEAQELTLKYYMEKSDDTYRWLQKERTWINKVGEILHPYEPHENVEKLIKKIDS